MDLQSSRASAAGLRGEGARFARYLLTGEEAVEEELARYEAGCEAVFSSSIDPGDAAVLRFAAERPWSLPYLDAACGVLDPQALLRKKLILLLAILETTTHHVDAFTPRPCPRWRALARLAGWGITGVFRAAIGVLLYPLARRAR